MKRGLQKKIGLCGARAPFGVSGKGNSLVRRARYNLNWTKFRKKNVNRSFCFVDEMVWQIYLAVCYCPASFVLSTTSLELLPIIGTSGQDTTRALACLRRAAQPPPPIVARSTALTWQTNRIMDNSSRSQSRGAAQRKSRNLYRIRWCRRWRRLHFSRYAGLLSSRRDRRTEQTR
jgi:hypothetical protein